MKYQEALSALKYKRETKFVLVGPEMFLKEHFTNVAEEYFKDTDFVTFFPNNQNQALDLIGSNSFFQKPLVILKYFDKYKTINFEEALKNYDGNLIVVLTEKVDTNSRSITKIVSNLTAVECNKFKEYGNDYPSWINAQISAAGYTANEEAIYSIFSRVGPNLFTLSRELEKIYLIKKDRVITRADAEKYVSVTSTSTSFEIFESLLKKDVRSALMCFESFSKLQDTFIDIVSFMGSYLEKMYKILAMKEKNLDIDNIADIVGIPRFIVKTRYLPKIQSLGKAFIASKIDALCQIDAQLRLFKGDRKILLERFIFSFN
jgi:DNA polymerase III, delta subunit